MSTLRVALFQTDPIWQDPSANRDLLAKQLNELTPCDLVVLPEMFTAGFGSDPKRFSEPADGETFQWLTRHSETHKTAICGSYGVDVGDKVANRLVWCHPSQQTAFYDKRHLFRMAGEHRRYTSGKNKLLVEYQGWRVNPQICYDLRFPVWCRSRNDFDLQIFVANWPGPRRLAWRTLLQARAIENQAYVIGVNRTGTDGKGLHYTGDSLVIAPDGEIILDAGDRAGVFSTELDLNRVREWREAFPAHLDADDFYIND